MGVKIQNVSQNSECKSKFLMWVKIQNLGQNSECESKFRIWVTVLDLDQHSVPRMWVKIQNLVQNLLDELSNKYQFSLNNLKSTAMTLTTAAKSTNLRCFMF